jgi:hypothetical protein
MARLDVLRYLFAMVSQATVRRHYQRWRNRQGLPLRCDNPECQFHTQPLIWNGKPLKLILDHIDGNRRDNRPEMLRYLCANCDSQLNTRGGGNRGRVEAQPDGFVIKRPDGRRDHARFLESSLGFQGQLDAEHHHARRGPTE